LDIKLIYIIAGIVFSAGAQIFMKIATGHEILRFPWLILISGSIMSYALAFSMYYVALKYFPISRVSPAMTVGVVILVVLFGLFSGEILTPKQLTGILFGIIAIFLIIL
jgi:drug/metabolite transporter (DMT)-like permease